jgi:hypothetical protein
MLQQKQTQQIMNTSLNNTICSNHLDEYDALVGEEHEDLEEEREFYDNEIDEHFEEQHININNLSFMSSASNDNKKNSQFLNFDCKICNKTFDNVHRLQRHMLCHDTSPELRKFKCDFCNKAFKFKHHLKVDIF